MACEIDWLAFLVAMAIVELTPGPNMGWLTAHSALMGRKAGFLAVAGITLGLCIQLVAAATGFSAFVAGNAFVFQMLRWGGVAFMLFLAWEAYSQTGETSPAAADGMAGFRRGFVANLLNPKALVFYIAVVAQFATCEAWPVLVQLLILGGVHILVSVIIHSGLVLLGSTLGARIAEWRRSIWVRLGFALALAGVAVWIAVSVRLP